MQKKLGCFFYPFVIFIGLSIITIIMNTTLDDPADEVFTVADTDQYQINYYMNNERTLFFKVANKSDNTLLIELVDVTSGGQKLKATASEGGEIISNEYAAATSGVDTLLATETPEQTEARMTALVRSEVAYAGREDENADFSLSPTDDELMNDLISNKVTGTLVVSIYNRDTGEITEVGRHDFTKEQGIDGQM